MRTNKQAVNDKELLYNEVTGALFIIKKNAMSYDADNQVFRSTASNYYIAIRSKS